MKLIALAVAFLLLAVQEPPKPEDSPLVKAAKASGGKRKPSTKVITNDDVKKSKGKLVTLPPKEVPTETTPADTKAPLAKQDDRYRARLAATKVVDDAEKKVAELEAELRRTEQAYYAESDLNRRDSVLVPRFEQTKKQLEVARKGLADARDALQACSQ
jgi:hypothetical protein